MKIISRKERWFWVLVAIGLIVIRIPALLKGRFWGEEGRVFFLMAYELPLHKALLFSHAGYLNLIGNIGGALANCVPLKYACRVTVYLALLVQSVPLILLAQSRASWLQERRFFVASLLFIATIPLCQEVWLNTTCSQHHLTLCTALILALEPCAGLALIFQCFVLILAGLSGPGSVLLAPLFFIRALFTRTKARIIHLLCIGTAAFIQLIFFWKPLGRHVQNLSGEQMTFGIEPKLFLDIVFVKQLLSPLMGYHETQDIAGNWAAAYQQGNLHLEPQIVLMLTIFSLQAYAIFRCRFHEARWLITTGMLLIIAGYAGALGSRVDSLLIGINDRYTFAPEILLKLSFLALLFQATGWKKRVWQAIVVWLLVIGVHEFFDCPSQFASGPSWKEEVHAWQQDPTHALKIWPADWAINLKPKHKILE